MTKKYFPKSFWFSEKDILEEVSYALATKAEMPDDICNALYDEDEKWITERQKAIKQWLKANWKEADYQAYIDALYSPTSGLINEDVLGECVDYVVESIQIPAKFLEENPL